MIRSCFGATAIAAAGLLAGCASTSAHPGALWTVVRACTLDSRLTGLPWPCLRVDRARGFAIVPDPKRRAQVLLVPTVRITGIESPLLSDAGARNYWALAWEQRTWLDRRLRRRLGDENVGLAINSVAGRTQDQLHIHIDCLRPSVRRAIDGALEGLGETWRELPTPLFRARRYRARWLGEAALSTADPFRLLARDPTAAGGTASHTLVMVAAARPSGERGFVLLNHRADPAHGDLGTGEQLLDHRCTVLRVGEGRP